jgi:hypothetical protein
MSRDNANATLESYIYSHLSSLLALAIAASIVAALLFGVSQVGPA